MPGPVEPKVSSVGREAAGATKPRRVTMPESRPVTKTYACSVRGAMGVKSSNGW